LTKEARIKMKKSIKKEKMNEAKNCYKRSKYQNELIHQRKIGKQTKPKTD
jgi:hypothetical protein